MSSMNEGGVQTDTSLDIKFASSLEVALYVRWRRALSGDESIPEAEPSSTLEKARNRWWQEIIREYTKLERRYHGLTHLQQMFGEMDRHVGRLTRPDRVALAVFFHDLIYDPRSSINEEKSAERFNAFAQEATRMSKEDIGVVHAYILATKTHQMSQSPEVDDDLALFLDIDMSILGQPREIYMRYAGAIRAEYKHVPRSLYLEKRAQILSSFIEGGGKYIKGGRQSLRREIYASQFYKNELEEQARDNIAGEIYMLRRGVIPYEDKER